MVPSWDLSGHINDLASKKIPLTASEPDCDAVWATAWLVRTSMAERAHILVVDDNISICKSMSLILGYNGYAVTIAGDGFEAIEKNKEIPFDVIFMDVKMPGMNGVETYRKIKQTRPDALVIMMTAYAVKDLVAEALQEGAYGAFEKPLDIDKVLSMVDKIVEGKR